MPASPRGSRRKKRSSAPPPRRGSRLGRAVFWVAAALFCAALLPVAQVGCARWVDPPFTPEMVRFGLFSDDRAAKARGLKYKWLPLEEIPRRQIHYIWASEDQRFFEHGGIDWTEIDLALAEAEESGEPPRGASTITMQCARSLFLWQGRSWARKALEAYYTVLMEAMLPKRRILELYLNVIEFGPGIYGIAAAAETHFSRRASELDPDQMALLAAVLPNPKGWDPAAPSPRLTQRKFRVLRLSQNAPFPADQLDRPAAPTGHLAR